jgi:hypothetical protein
LAAAPASGETISQLCGQWLGGLESRNSMGYIIAFDNIDGTATGIAVNAVSNQQVSVPVTVHNDAGAVLTKDTITLPRTALRLYSRDG